MLYFKNFNNILSLQNLKDLIEIQNLFKEKNILILGYYFNNIFFFKKDLKISNIDISLIYPLFKKRKKKIKEMFINIIIYLKKNLKKLILILLKKNGNN